MTVQNSNVKNIYIGNGSTTSFPFTFPCPKADYIKVFVRKNNLIAQTDDFTVDLDNATVTYPKSGTPLAAGENLVILRELPLEQPLNLVNQGPFFAEDIETTLDEEVMMIQQLREQLGRSLTVPVDIDAENAFETSVPIKPGMSFRVKDDGSGFEVTTDPGKVIDEANALHAQINKDVGALLEQTKAEANKAVDAKDGAEQALKNTTDKATEAAESLKLIQKHKALWYDNIAAMKADVSIKIGSYACTAGYYKANDGGGGSYIIRAKTVEDVEDGGSIHFLQKDLVAELIVENGTVNVKQFGARGDGERDDFSAINNMFAYAKVRGVEIALQQEVYKVASPLLLDGFNGLRFYGNGAIFKYDGPNSNDTTVFMIKNTTNSIFENYTVIVNGAFYDRYTQYEQYLIERKIRSASICIYACDGVVLKNVISKRGLTGFSIGLTSKNCKLIACQSIESIGDGVECATCSNILVLGHYDYKCQDDCYSANTYMDNTNIPTHVTFQSCSAIACYGRGLTTSGRYITMRDCYINGGHQMPFLFETRAGANAEHCLIDKCYFCTENEEASNKYEGRDLLNVFIGSTQELRANDCIVTNSYIETKSASKIPFLAFWGASNFIFTNNTVSGYEMDFATLKKCKISNNNIYCKGGLRFRNSCQDVHFESNNVKSVSFVGALTDYPIVFSNCKNMLELNNSYIKDDTEPDVEVRLYGTSAYPTTIVTDSIFQSDNLGVGSLEISSPYPIKKSLVAHATIQFKNGQLVYDETGGKMYASLNHNLVALN